MLRGFFRGGSVYVFTFRFKAKENLQRCGDVLFDILIASKGALALDMRYFETLTGIKIRVRYPLRKQ